MTRGFIANQKNFGQKDFSPLRMEELWSGIPGTSVLALEEGQ
jgi:hypothetical protein